MEASGGSLDGRRMRMRMKKGSGLERSYGGSGGEELRSAVTGEVWGLGRLGFAWLGRFCVCMCIFGFPLLSLSVHR